MDAKEQVRQILHDPLLYMEKLVTIKTKQSTLEKLKLNYMQNKVYEVIRDKKDSNGSVKIISLKARQHGISTLVDGLGFHNVVTRKNRTFAIVTHEDKATKNLFERMKLIQDNLPKTFKPEEKYSNAQELVFQSKNPELSINSQIKCYTAGSSEIGRSETINFLHLSELAFWKPTTALDNFTAIMQAVPKDDSIVVVESTANGYNFFKNLWDDAVQGKNDFIPIFIAWFENPEYMINGILENMTVDEQNLKDMYNLYDEQLLWRRWCTSTNCGSDLNKFHQEYPSNPEEAFISSGNPCFNNELVIQRIEILRKQERTIRKGSFFVEYISETKDAIKSWKFNDNVNNYIEIFEEPSPNAFYVIGADTKGDGSDNYACTVIDNNTGERVARLWGDIAHNTFVEQLYALGMYYNTALISVEVNFNMYPIEELKRLNYPKQYVRKIYDNYKGLHKETYGWKTDGNTRDLIISKEQVLIQNNIDLFNDIDMLQECITFVKDKNGRYDAMVGKHDDLLFSDMIAEASREQQQVYIEVVNKKIKRENTFELDEAENIYEAVISDSFIDY